MTFEEWWAQLPTSEQKLLGKNNAKFVWEEAQKNHINMLTLPSFVIGRHADTVSIMSFHGEGGTFNTKEFDNAVSRFFAEKF
jgi:hypothetical protein